MHSKGNIENVNVRRAYVDVVHNLHNKHEMLVFFILKFFFKHTLSDSKEYRLTTEFQAQYYDKLATFRQNIQNEEQRLLKQTLMRVKSIKIKNYAQDKEMVEKLNIKNSTQIPADPYKDRMSFIRKLHRNTDKRFSFIDNYRNSRSVKQLDTHSLEKMKQTEFTKTVLLDTYRPKASKRESFNESIDGFRLSVPTNARSINNSYSENDDSKLLDITQTTVTTKTPYEHDPDSIALSTLNFPRLNKSPNDLSPPNSCNDRFSNSSTRREKSGKYPKQSLKPKSAKLLFEKDNRQDSMFQSYYNNKWQNEETEMPLVRTASLGKNSYSNKKGVLRRAATPNGGLLPPSTTPIMSYNNADYITLKPHKSESRLKNNHKIDILTNKGHVYVYKGIPEKPKSGMQLKDMIRFIKPSKRYVHQKTPSTEKKSGMQVLNFEELKFDDSLQFNGDKDSDSDSSKENEIIIKPETPKVIPTVTDSSSNTFPFKKSSNKYEISIKIPLDDNHN